MLSRSSPSDPDALLNEVQAADLLCLSIRTLQAWRNQDRGPDFVRAGRAIRYRKGALVDWTSSNTCRPSVAKTSEDSERSAADLQPANSD